MATKLGKTYPCFGEFQCPRCRKKWQSSKAWADYGQECKSCSIKVMPSELQKLFVYICSYCQAKWNWAYKPRGLKCKRCSSSILVLPLDRENYQDRQYIKAHTLRELNHDDNENHINPNKEHREDLCEKCQKLGRPCHQTAGQDYRIFPNQTSFANKQGQSSHINRNEHKRMTSSTSSPSLHHQTVYQQSVTNRSSVSNTNFAPSIRNSSTYDSTSSNKSESDSWCIIL